MKIELNNKDINLLDRALFEAHMKARNSYTTLTQEGYIDYYTGQPASYARTH
jgi:hypothetical protein